MTNVICIAGLPGSGKTHLANCLVPGAYVVDDIKSLDQLPENGSIDTLILTDPYFCMDVIREQAQFRLSMKYDSVNWVFFENAPEKCLINIRHRADGRLVEGLIKALAMDYHPPNDARLIWQPQES